MNTILWFDSVGGASGDMILACLMDLGITPEHLNATFKKLGDFSLSVEAVPHDDHGLHGLRARVHTHEHPESGHGHDAKHHHAHRGLSEITCLIGHSKLSAPVKQQSLAVFRRLAEAEARVHNKTPEEIHFHEVGALDAIADIVGACEALALLNVDGVGFSPLPAGHGTIQCAHGVIPNPPPGTVELLKGLPIVFVDEPFELVTPTGAALLSTWRTLDTPPAGWTVSRVGHGFGQRHLNGRPNLLRATLLTPCPGVGQENDSCLVLETNIDDTSPELVGALIHKLLAAGAHDAYITAIQMKKQRSGMLLTTLCAPEKKAVMIDLIFSETTTFGIREHLTHRTMLARETVVVKTPYGEVCIKIGTWKGKAVTASPEYEDCVARASAASVPVRAVYEAAQAEGQKRLTR
jgi:uncharacterized protein (TIGR00299 family) protein